LIIAKQLDSDALNATTRLLDWVTLILLTVQCRNSLCPLFLLFYLVGQMRLVTVELYRVELFLLVFIQPRRGVGLVVNGLLANHLDVVFQFKTVVCHVIYRIQLKLSHDLLHPDFLLLF